MTIPLPPRIIAEFSDHEGLLSGLRIRLNELNIAGESLDEIMGLPDGYTSKVLGAKPARGLTKEMLGTFLGGLGVRCVLIEDIVATAKIMRHSKARYRNPNLVRPAIRIVFTHRELQKMGRAGGKARLIKMTAAARKRIAKKAIRTRWSRERRLKNEGKQV